MSRRLANIRRIAASQKVDGCRRHNRLTPRWHPHQLRHSRATEIRKRYAVEAAQVVLGHTGADVTQIYAERNDKLAKKIAAENG